MSGLLSGNFFARLKLVNTPFKENLFHAGMDVVTKNIHKIIFTLDRSELRLWQELIMWLRFPYLEIKEKALKKGVVINDNDTNFKIDEEDEKLFHHAGVTKFLVSLRLNQIAIDIDKRVTVKPYANIGGIVMPFFQARKQNILPVPIELLFIIITFATETESLTSDQLRIFIFKHFSLLTKLMPEYAAQSHISDYKWLIQSSESMEASEKRIVESQQTLKLPVRSHKMSKS